MTYEPPPDAHVRVFGRVVAGLPLDGLHRAIVGQGRPTDGLVYQPDPDTKPERHQPPDVLELLLPFLALVHEGAVVRLDLPTSQAHVTGPEVTDPAAAPTDPHES